VTIVQPIKETTKGRCFPVLEQCVNEGRSSGATESDKDAQHQNGNDDRDEVPLFIVSYELQKLPKEARVLPEFVG
jgi:hypothetical protein